MDSSNVYTATTSTPGQGSDWRSAKESWIVTRDKYGLSQNPEKDPLSLLPSQPESISQRRIRIVVVEDNKADIFLVEEAIAVHGIDADVEFILDGEEAIKRIRKFREQPSASYPAMFVLDLNLPKRSGNEVLAFIREQFDSIRIPVLIMTSSDLLKDREEAKRLDADGYFRKPSGYDEFLEIGPMIKGMLR